MIFNKALDINEMEEEERTFPALFIGHGSPLNVLVKEGKYYKGLQNFFKSNPIPDSIVVL